MENSRAKFYDDQIMMNNSVMHNHLDILVIEEINKSVCHRHSNTQ